MLTESTVKIEIRCPACNKKGSVEVGENIINKSKRGITAINVANYLVCDHAFIAYIDKNLMVRDCFVCDFNVELPKIEIEQKKKAMIPHDFDTDIVKYNMVPSFMVYIFKGILYGKKIVLISELGELNHHFINFFKYLMTDTFKSEFLVLSQADFKKHKKEYKDHIVFQGNQIVSGKDKIFNPKDIKIESSIIQNFFAEHDSELALFTFKNEILKIYRLSQDLIAFNNDLKEKEEFNSKKATDYIYQTHHTRIPYNYLSLVIDVIEKYFKVKLKKSTDTADLLGYL